ncbi:MAG: DUF349 domain-containing protein [Cyclobacteriaceae bacterium]
MEELEVPFGRIEGSSIIRAAWGDHEERIIGEIKKDDHTASIQYFLNRFEELKEKVKELQDRILNAENKGSFYMQLKHLQSQLATHDGLGDYAHVSEIIQEEIRLIEGIILQNREKNTEIKTALLQELTEAVGLVSWKEAGEKVKDIRQRWIKTGQVAEEHQKRLENSFQEITKDFFERRQGFYDDRARLAKHHEEEYKRIIDEAKKLDHLDESARASRLKELSSAWKENGAVPAEKYQPLQKEFQLLIKKKKSIGVDPEEQLKVIEDKLKSEIISYKAAKQIQQELKNIRPRNDHARKRKQTAFHLIHKIIERNFVEQLVEKKFRNYQKMSENEKRNSKSRLLRDLIERDKKELDLISMNLEKFNTRDPQTQKMMNQKLNIQKQKISVKEELLSELKS